MNKNNIFGLGKTSFKFQVCSECWPTDGLAGFTEHSDHFQPSDPFEEDELVS